MMRSIEPFFRDKCADDYTFHDSQNVVSFFSSCLGNAPSQAGLFVNSYCVRLILEAIDVDKNKLLRGFCFNFGKSVFVYYLKHIHWAFSATFMATLRIAQSAVRID